MLSAMLNMVDDIEYCADAYYKSFYSNGTRTPLMDYYIHVALTLTARSAST